jgi:hypothetical protein
LRGALRSVTLMLDRRYVSPDSWAHTSSRTCSPGTQARIGFLEIQKVIFVVSPDRIDDRSANLIEAPRTQSIGGAALLISTATVHDGKIRVAGPN